MKKIKKSLNEYDIWVSIKDTYGNEFTENYYIHAKTKSEANKKAKLLFMKKVTIQSDMSPNGDF